MTKRELLRLTLAGWGLMTYLGGSFVHAQQTESNSDDGVAVSSASPDSSATGKWALAQGADEDNIKSKPNPVDDNNHATERSKTYSESNNIESSIEHTIESEAEQDSDSNAMIEDNQEIEDLEIPESAEDGINSIEQIDSELEKEARRIAVIQARQRRADLQAQFEQLQLSLQDEDAYSLELAENYFGYGLLLRNNGQPLEAINAFKDALHIQKVNHGIYSIEQRAALEQLFETHYSLGNNEEYEDYLERILWVEGRNPDIKDSLSYNILLRVGNHYIDEYLRDPGPGQDSVQTLLRARHHLSEALKRYQEQPLNQDIKPYGELALIGFLEFKLHADVDKTASLEDSRLLGSRALDGREFALASYLSKSFPRGEIMLAGYLKQAQDEENDHHIVKSLLALADYNQLFDRHRYAKPLYLEAWRRAQELPLDDKLRDSFNTPVALPAFDYSYDRKQILPDRPSIVVPVKLRVAATGRVTGIVKQKEEEALPKAAFGKAKRRVRRLVFRPRIEDGSFVETLGVQHDARVFIGRKKSKSKQTTPRAAGD